MKILKFVLGVAICGSAFVSSSYAQRSITTDLQEKATKPTKILIPTAFSPNNDGINDVFKLDNIGEEQLIEFRVFNRWGTILFSTKDIYSGWNGTYKGEVQPTGLYGYIIQIKLADGRVELFRGTVTLVK